MEFDTTYIVESERLVIRPYRADDAQAYQSFYEGISGMKMSLWDATEAVRDKSSMFGPRTPLYLAAFDKAASGVIHSHITLSPYTHRVRTLGYGTQVNSRGKGYMREALSALVNDAFARDVLDGFIADVKFDNTASQRVLVGSGFELDTSRRGKEGWFNYRRMANRF